MLALVFLLLVYGHIFELLLDMIRVEGKGWISAKIFISYTWEDSV